MKKQAYEEACAMSYSLFFQMNNIFIWKNNISTSADIFYEDLDEYLQLVKSFQI